MINSSTANQSRTIGAQLAAAWHTWSDWAFCRKPLNISRNHARGPCLALPWLFNIAAPLTWSGNHFALVTGAAGSGDVVRSPDASDGDDVASNAFEGDPEDAMSDMSD